MPRPGPRPYECVRRAWHSDRHQPMRGSIIQQIFRVVTESHSSATRKNREWQAKLPRVVLKAEEIMYSKANSESEYMDRDTLWERLNDAVDTIIRRDESAETGQFLQPCIEAALVLGCVPVRASRSQRHSNPRSYLNPGFQEPAQAAPATVDQNNNHHRLHSQPPPPRPPSACGHQLPVSTATTENLASPTSPFNSQTGPNNSYIATHTGPHVRPNFPQPMPSTGTESNTLLNSGGSAYPLYYGSHFQNMESQCRFQSLQNSNPNNIIIGTPVGWPGGQPSRFASTRNLLPHENAIFTADEPRQEEPVDTPGHTAENVCDLSLRLGPSDPCMSVKKGLTHVAKDGGCRGSSSRQEGGKHFEPFAKNPEFCFFPRSSDPFESCNNVLEQEGEFQDKNETLRKRKAPDPHELEDGCIQWRADLQSNQFHSQGRWPGPEGIGVC